LARKLTNIAGNGAAIAATRAAELLRQPADTYAFFAAKSALGRDSVVFLLHCTI
jgi:hypothetical protein